VSVSADPRIGSELLSYRIEALLGRGGMGVVYRAHDPRLKRNVALKLLSSELAEDERFRERFLRESELAASIDHPSIVPIYEAGEVDGQLYIAMRYVEGTDLKKLLRSEGALEPRRAHALVAQLADALDAAHARGLVHRDVKPSNALLDGADHLYLADFGLTKSSSDRGALTATGRMVGTVDYAAPEQIEGADVDGRADLYSLGALLYECLTGEVPFPRESELAVLWAHVQEEPPKASERNPSLPEAIDAAIAKAMAKEPGKRYQTCQELVEAVREALGLREILIVRDRRPLLLAATGLALAVGAALAAFFLSQGSGGQPKPSTKPTLALTADALQRIDPKTNKLVATIAVGTSNAGALAVGAGSIWVASADDNFIYRIDPKTNRFVSIPGNGSPTGLAFGGGFLWVLNSLDNNVVQIDPGANAIIHSTPVPAGVAIGAIAADANGVWIPEETNKTNLTFIDPESLAAKAIRVVGSDQEIPSFYGAAAGRGGIWLLSHVAPGLDKVSKLEPSTRKLIANVPLPNCCYHHVPANNPAVGAEGVWVVMEVGDLVAQVDPARNRLKRAIHVGSGPADVAVGLGSAWVANVGAGTVSRIDPRRGKIVTTIRVGPNPSEVVVGEGSVWVAVHP
jgi:DNA-binding beta-propeller fold protein YncE